MKIGKPRPKGVAGTRPARKVGDPKPDGYVFGRPTNYRPEYCQSIIEFFDRDPWEINTDAKGSSKAIPKEKVPTVIRWCREIGVKPRTLIDWRKNNPEFEEAYEMAMMLQKSFLIEGAGIVVNPAFTNFMLKSDHKMVEPKAEEPEENKPLEIRIVKAVKPGSE